jgi:MSHA biogenesis protein MshL
MMRGFLILCAAFALLACAAPSPPMETSVQDNISSELRLATAAPRPRAEPAVVPPAVTGSLLPPLRSEAPRPAARQLEHRFDIKVTDAPIGQVLLAIVQDTPYSILLVPKTVPPALPSATGGSPPASVVAARSTETMTVNLKNVNIFEALDAVRELSGYDYTVDGTRIYVQAPELRTKLYLVNYIVGQRRGVSDLQVIAGASGGGGGGGGGSSGSSGGGAQGGGSSGGGYASIQASALSTISKADVWGEMEEAIRTALGCQVARSQLTGSGGSSAGGAGATGAAAASAGSSRADVTFVGDRQSGERLQGGDGCPEGRAVKINSMSGSALVRAMPRELRIIESMLRSMQISIERQVIIEAKIIDVELNAGSQQGINWAVFNHGVARGSVGANTGLVDASTTASRGTVGAGTSLGELLGNQQLFGGVAAPNALSTGLGIALQATNFSALIDFLESQGRVQVLSSPRISTLNNQKAVLKVGVEEPFVTKIEPGQQSIAASSGTVATVSPPTLTYQPFFSGISLDVTPQIDENDNITLHVHSMVNSIVEKEKVALPVANALRVPFAVNNISETDSVVKTRDSQIVVIGGLMKQSTSDDRSQVPGVGDAPLLGALFGKTGRLSSKRELVILLKTTVVKGEETWAGEIGAARDRIDRMIVRPTRPAP